MAIELQTLRPDSTLADLPTSQTMLDSDATGQALQRTFESAPDLPGLIVVH